MDYWQLVQQVAESVLAVLLPVVLGAVAVWLRGVLQGKEAELQAKIGDRRLWQIGEIVSAAVAAAEQVGLTQELEDLAAYKRDAALSFAEQLLAEHNIQMDLRALEAMIEAEVMNQFNRQKLLPAD